MPEGHVLHRIARLHQRVYAGQALTVTSPQGRFAAEAVDGRVLVKAEAHGKHLLHVYGPDAIVHVHLGLYGKFAEHEPPVTEPVGQVRMRIVGERNWTDLRGPAACEVLTLDGVAALRARLGPDPLRRDAKPAEALARVRRSKQPLATLLMDQKVVAGIGNIYRAELLFRHGLDPMKQGSAVDEELWAAMWPDLVALMRDGVKAGRIDTVRPEHLPEATGRAPREDRHGGEVYVYRRAGQPCLVCGTPVAHAVLAARNLYWCPTCQRG
ncbi:Fpg/Nei family DNA glycosylase [Actinosynnema pretiosum subsp. pretiosum]|uniref:DNA-(apurinic or apyrimidinic site) lyase n=1 Tax=Actinosynnema pretiosum subsp. pretiosum TaxID=103721 RepID=A0AA45LDB9_9PSEU|nr:Formamidopyrimidine-DNA glycosylase [Actinosynnema pretiosum subsp. pretiosum]QUF07195.1 Fpg/Nei family DNA glycosylase [Actinosynnema pretiosum subsp. pretiosum]